MKFSKREQDFISAKKFFVDDLEYDEDDLLEMANELGSFEKILLKHPNPKELIEMILQNMDCDSSASLLDELRKEFLSFAEHRERLNKSANSSRKKLD